MPLCSITSLWTKIAGSFCDADHGACFGDVMPVTKTQDTAAGSGEAETLLLLGSPALLAAMRAETQRGRGHTVAGWGRLMV